MAILSVLFFLFVGLLDYSALGGTYNLDRDIGDVVPAWKNLPGTDGKQHSWDDVSHQDFVVVVFTCNSCPYAIDYEDRIEALSRLAQESDSRFAVVAINSNQIPEDSLQAMQKRSREKQFSFPYLTDATQDVSRAFGAIRTPEFFILDHTRRIRYMGAMDDNAEASHVKEQYLFDALKALKQGRAVTVTETPPIGCMIRKARKKRYRP